MRISVIGVNDTCYFPAATFLTSAGQNTTLQGTGPIFLSTLGCGDSDDAIINCSRTNRIGLTECMHSQDVSVRCQGKLDS